MALPPSLAPYLAGARSYGALLADEYRDMPDADLVTLLRAQVPEELKRHLKTDEAVAEVMVMSNVPDLPAARESLLTISGLIMLLDEARV